jgi:hypothetical protein
VETFTSATETFTSATEVSRGNALFWRPSRWFCGFATLVGRRDGWNSRAMSLRQILCY